MGKIGNQKKFAFFFATLGLCAGNHFFVDFMDINFRGDQAQLLGMKGRIAISRQDAKAIMYAIQQEFSIRA